MQRLSTAIFLIFSVAVSSPVFSQGVTDTAYQRTINERAGKIVKQLSLTDATKSLKVQSIISDQYIQLNALQAERDNAVKAVKGKAGADKAATDQEILSIDNDINARVQKLHDQYISRLTPELTPVQIEKVKDGMTYGVVPITYKGYVEMIPSLTDPQKAQILAWLVEAREHAMDAFTSEKKHAWFGKYKGRINNYLSAQGYDSKKERDEWMKRIKAAEDAKVK